jgi:hypothetical protein
MARLYRKKSAKRRKAIKRKPQIRKASRSPFELILASNKNFTETKFHPVTGKKAKGVMDTVNRKWYPNNACGIEEFKRDSALGYIR